MKFHNGKIENRLYVIEDTNSTQYWEISIAETFEKGGEGVIRYGMAFNRKTEYIYNWQAFPSARFNDDVFSEITKTIALEHTQIG